MGELVLVNKSMPQLVIIRVAPQVSCIMGKKWGTTLVVKFKTMHYGNTGCRVFKQVVQNWKDFCLKT